MEKLKNKIRQDYAFAVPFLGAVYAVLRDWRFYFRTKRVTYNESELISVAACDFMNDERYTKARDIALAQSGRKELEYGGDWRLYTYAWAAEHAKNIEGDFAECGVNRGITSRMICDYVGFKDLPKTFYLCDLFESADASYGNCYEETKAMFAPFENVKVIKGSVPEVLSKIDSKKFAFVSIDMNAVEPEMGAIDFFWDKMSKGGVIVLCDYGVYGRKPQRNAWNLWAAKHGVSVLSLATTQGMILKP